MYGRFVQCDGSTAFHAIVIAPCMWLPQLELDACSSSSSSNDNCGAGGIKVFSVCRELFSGLGVKVDLGLLAGEAAPASPAAPN